MILLIEESGPRAITIATCRHGVFALSGRDFIGDALREYGEWANGELELLLPLVAEGDVVIDVGSHIGTEAVPLAKRLGPEGILVAFEPQLEMYRLLAMNMALNGLDNVHTVHSAVGDVAGSIALPAVDYKNDGNYGAMTLRGRSLLGEGEAVAATVVPVVTLDDSFPNLPACRLIRLDVEGMEAFVLKGGQELIRRCRPLLYCECARPAPALELAQLLGELGYSAFWHAVPFFNPNNHRGSTFNPAGRAGDLNVLCVPDEVDSSWLDLPPMGDFEEVLTLFPGLLTDASGPG